MTSAMQQRHRSFQEQTRGIPDRVVFEDETDDRHLALAKELAELLRARFPEGSIGITGSVAKKSHRPESDIDFLLVDPGLAGNYQFVFVKDGIKINVLGLTPQFRQRLDHYVLRFFSTFTGYIANLCPVHDPHGYIGEMVRENWELIGKRRQSGGILRAGLDRELEGLVGEDGRIVSALAEDRPRMMTILQLLIDYRFIQLELDIYTKWGCFNAMNLLREADPEFHRLVAETLPPGPETLPRFDQMRAILAAHEAGKPIGASR
ncbi:Nucleotidyltransferase domain-containing protein [Sulfidibacter corallicola]|uniref:Nucleotidyltransferase domain-containing protein n=1 Tax=Sulfidibacter corallicola TaxID=2818388 RepID=A0A8A4TZ64_SULCO|nr:nucleotidyltransferase domain-containing protein [Sulfidibacter corallicola]QTD51805.1 nucleotidyltransferase domain-containing protein [Sulfidibacter corallicola]